jgi:selenide,water dikinase
VDDPAVVSGLAAADDAAIYRIADNLCLVQTVDVFTPCVDDPALFGRICAANCLSDIYAMGGEPRSALSILGFPSESLDSEIMFQMLAGAMALFAEADVSLVGGHSIKEEEIKLGFAITGTIDPAVARSLDQPRAGDVLVLTKPLGTGVLAFCHQIGRDAEAGYAAASQAMATLNKAAAEAMKAAGATACTDITGFGLFGHLLRLVRPAQLSARIDASALPAFEGALEALRQGIIPGAIERNREFAGPFVKVAAGVDEAQVNLGFDAQTSGGLLIAIPQVRLKALLEALTERGVRGVIIGQLLPAAEQPIIVTQGEINLNSLEPMQAKPSENQCCCPTNLAATSTVEESQRAFGAFMNAVQAGGILDEKTKELILFSLVVFSRCAPCFDAHYGKAQKLGLSQSQLDEAAWCAIALGGAPVKMFYQERLKKVSAPAGGTSCCAPPQKV